MNCGKCKNEVIHELDDEGMDYVKPCSRCFKLMYDKGFARGWIEAKGDPIRLVEILKERKKKDK